MVLMLGYRWLGGAAAVQESVLKGSRWPAKTERRSRH
jgi:hypothetical protein